MARMRGHDAKRLAQIHGRAAADGNNPVAAISRLLKKSGLDAV
jgi:hypothetical protein